MNRAEPLSTVCELTTDRRSPLVATQMFWAPSSGTAGVLACPVATKSPSKETNQARTPAVPEEGVR